MKVTDFGLVMLGFGIFFSVAHFCDVLAELQEIQHKHEMTIMKLKVGVK